MRISIIGAGPAGSYSAYLLARQGHEVHVFEEHSTIGLPFQCTGILTSYLEQFIDPTPVLKQKLDTFHISTWDQSVDIKVKQPNLVLCRTSFDQYLAKLAKEAGAHYHLQHRYLSNDKDFVKIRDKHTNTILKQPYDLLIGADGPNSTVAKENKFKGTRNFWVGAQARVRMPHTNKVEVYPHIGVFAWVVPESSDICRVGLYSKTGVQGLFQDFLERRDCTEIIDRQGGLIPEYHPDIETEKIVHGRKICLVGDAALQVKATTGGGIIPGLKGAQCLAEAIQENTSYDRRWRKAMGLDLWLHRKLHYALQKMQPADWNQLIQRMRSPRAQQTIAWHDREYPSRFLLSLLWSEPRLLRFARFLFPVTDERPKP